MNHFPPTSIRDAILSSIPNESSQFGSDLIDPSFLYSPVRHAEALNPNTMLVVGSRGAGKSFWWAALLKEEYRLIISQTLPKAGLSRELDVRPGFGQGVSIRQAPNKDVLLKLLSDFEPREIWRGVVGWQMLTDSRRVKGDRWEDRVRWVRDNPEEFELSLEEEGELLTERSETRLVVFDALDTAADNWSDLRRLLRGLLQVTLEFRSRQRMRLKIFVRPDMIQDPEISSFPDASKVLSSKAPLEWSLVDLYGLLWQMLANAPTGGKNFREAVREGFGLRWERIGESWKVPLGLRTDEDLQRNVFHALSGPWMGQNAKRGFPYTWLPNHLADSFGQVSPRSFQVALRAAAEYHPPSDWTFALHHEGIRQGVQEASRIRVRELTEDYSWVDPAMEALRGQVIIPCWPGEIFVIWSFANTLQEVEFAAQSSTKLGPRRLEKGEEGLVQDLEELGIFQRLPDGRLQMPDVYRVAFGLGRKGGIKPIR